MHGFDKLWLVSFLRVIVLFTFPSPPPMPVRPFIDVGGFIVTAHNAHGGFDDQIRPVPSGADLIEKARPNPIRALRIARAAHVETEELLFGERGIPLPNERRFIPVLAESWQTCFDPVPEMVLCHGESWSRATRLHRLMEICPQGQQRGAKGRQRVVLRVNR